MGKPLPPRAACGHFLLGAGRECQACKDAAKRKQERPPVLPLARRRQAIDPATIGNWMRRNSEGESFGTIARKDGTVSSETVRLYVQRARAAKDEART